PRRLLGSGLGEVSVALATRRRRCWELREPRQKRIEHRGARELDARPRLNGSAEQYGDPCRRRGRQSRQRVGSDFEHRRLRAGAGDECAGELPQSIGRLAAGVLVRGDEKLGEHAVVHPPALPAPALGTTLAFRRNRFIGSYWFFSFTRRG